MAAESTRGPTLTVAIPTCNGARHLRETLKGVSRQVSDGVSFDLLVCDDRSDDETLGIVAEVVGDRARVAVNPDRLGLAGNWNRCVTLSRTPLVAILHQDDTWLDGHLARHLDFFRRAPDLGWVASSATVIDAEGSPVAASMVERGGLGNSDRIFEEQEAIAPMAIANPLRCSSVTIAAKAHAQVGGFDPTLRYVVDWDFWVRVAANHRVGWSSEADVAVRWHLGSETHRFAAGTEDLGESARLIGSIARIWQPATAPERSRLGAMGKARLSRAYLNRAYLASRRGDRALTARCLAESFRLSSRTAVAGLIDPRLAARLAWALVSGSPQAPADV